MFIAIQFNTIYFGQKTSIQVFISRLICCGLLTVTSDSWDLFYPKGSQMGLKDLPDLQLISKGQRSASLEKNESFGR